MFQMRRSHRANPASRTRSEEDVEKAADGLKLLRRCGGVFLRLVLNRWQHPFLSGFGGLSTAYIGPRSRAETLHLWSTLFGRCGGKGRFTSRPILILRTAIFYCETPRFVYGLSCQRYRMSGGNLVKFHLGAFEQGP